MVYGTFYAEFAPRLIHDLNPRKGCCCCLSTNTCCPPLSRSVLPIVHSIRICIWIGPATAFVTIAGTVTCAVWLPFYFFATYWTLLVTSKFGPNLKLLMILLAPIPLALMLPATVLGSFIWGIGLACVGTWDIAVCGSNPCGAKVMKLVAEAIHDIWSVVRACVAVFVRFAT